MRSVLKGLGAHTPEKPKPTFSAGEKVEVVNKNGVRQRATFVRYQGLGDVAQVYYEGARQASVVFVYDVEPVLIEEAPEL
jgi:hypothetical protein